MALQTDRFRIQHARRKAEILRRVLAKGVEEGVLGQATTVAELLDKYGEQYLKGQCEGAKQTRHIGRSSPSRLSRV